jgi:hypothetical protein
MDRRQRHGSNYGRNIGSDEQTRRYAEHNDVMAKAAELWAAGYLGLDTSIVRSSRGRDPLYDMVLQDGRRIDVKWSHWNPGQRYGRKADPGYPTLNIWKRDRADLYVLICGEDRADFDRNEWAHGWATKAEAYAAPIVASRYGADPYRCLGFDYLHPLYELREYHHD